MRPNTASMSSGANSRPATACSGCQNRVNAYITIIINTGMRVCVCARCFHTHLSEQEAVRALGGDDLAHHLPAMPVALVGSSLS
jgi:hypothetical protein